MKGSRLRSGYSINVRASGISRRDSWQIYFWCGHSFNLPDNHRFLVEPVPPPPSVLNGGIPTASAKLLLGRMLAKIEGLCDQRDRLKKEEGGSTKGRVLGGRSW